MNFRLCWLLLAVILASCDGGSDSEEPTASSTFNVPVTHTTCQITPQPGSTHFTYGPVDSVALCAVTEQPSKQST